MITDAAQDRSEMMGTDALRGRRSDRVIPNETWLPAGTGSHFASSPQATSSWANKIERDRTVTILRPGTVPAPEEKSTNTTQPLERAPRRRRVQLAVLAATREDPAPPPPRLPTMPEPRRRHFAPTARDDWLRLAEWLVGDWAATLRQALRLALLFLAVVLALGVTLGVGVALATVLIGMVVFLAGRRRGGPTPT
jgi:hypothetical protein